MQITRREFYHTQTVLNVVKEKIAAASARNERIDYLTFVPDGEPTLDIHLAEMLSALKPLGIPLAVISNTSLLSIAAVRAALLLADWVSLKMDAVSPAIWKRIDRPHGLLRLDDVLNGAQAFADDFSGQLVTETMLVAGVNDAPAELTKTARAIAQLNPATAYLGIPTRPPAEPWVHPPHPSVLNQAYQIFAAILPHVELLTGYEGNTFANTGDPAADLLSITAVHPMRKDALQTFLAQSGAQWELVENLIAQQQLLPIDYHGQTFYLRKFDHTL